MELFLGIDGGATKTAGVLLDAAGRVHARARTGGTAMIGEPSPETCSRLKELVSALCRQAGTKRKQIRCAGLGLNGVDFEDEHEAQLSAVSRAVGVPASKVSLVNDGIVALWGATSAPAAAILQHGTGFTAAYRTRIGGETLFDHLGVGRTFDLRWELPALVARMIDGRAESTPLKDAVLAHFGLAADRYAEAVFRERVDPERIAGTAPLVYAAWENGDAAAAMLVERALDDYALAARTMLARTGSSRPVMVFEGGVIDTAPASFRERLTERVHRHCAGAEVQRAALPPETGAAILAAYAAGHDPTALFDAVCGEEP